VCGHRRCTPGTTFWAALAVLAVALSAASAEAAVFTAADVKGRTLDNGVRVIVREAHEAPIVALDVYIRFGSALETDETNGVAHTIEHLVFQGMEGSRVGRLPRLIEGLGGRVTAETSRDHTHFAVALSPEGLEEAATQLAVAIRNPETDPTIVARERSIIAHELAQQADNPVLQLQELSYRLGFTKHGYRLSPGGTRESLANLSRADIQRAHDAYYTGPNTAVVVVGDVDVEEAFRVVSAAFGSFPATPPPPRPDTEEPRRMTRKVAPPVERATSRHFLMLGFPAPGVAAAKDDVCPMDVLMAALGEGRASRFQRRVVGERKLADEMLTIYLTQRDPGAFYVWAVTPDGGSEAAVNAVLEEIADIRAKGLPADDLDRAKQQILGSFAVQSETYMDQAATLGFYESIGGYEFALEYEERVGAVTSADVQRVASTYLDPELYTLVQVRPKAAAH